MVGDLLSAGVGSEAHADAVVGERLEVEIVGAACPQADDPAPPQLGEPPTAQEPTDARADDRVHVARDGDQLLLCTARSRDELGVQTAEQLTGKLRADRRHVDVEDAPDSARVAG